MLEAEIVLGVLYRKGVKPPKVGTLGSRERLFCRNNLASQRITSKTKITSRGYFYACFKGYCWRVFNNNLTKQKQL